MKLATAVLAAVVGAVSLGCQEVASPLSGSGDEAPPPRLSAPFDVSAVIRGVNLRFRSTPQGFANAMPTFRAEVSPSGRLTLGSSMGKASAGPARERGPLGVETLSVTRGAEVLSTESRASLGRDGAVHIDRGAVREVLASSEAGVEQSWVFAELPRGEGALRVEVAVRGQPFSTRTAQGLHFSGWRYGLATWVDATGTRTGLVPRYEQGRIVIDVPAELLERSSYPATLDPVLSPERAPNEPDSWPAQGGQETPAIATDGTNYLVVWEDGGAILGVRVAPGGQLLDPESLVIASTQNFSKSVPAVAFGGTQYLVVWQDRNLSSSTDEGDIRGARVSPGGVLLDATARTLCATTATQRNPVVASDGTDFFVAWEDRRGTGPGLYGTAIRANGTVVTANGVALATGAGNQRNAAIAHGGGSYLLVWGNDSFTDIRGTRVNGGNTVLARDFAVSPGSSGLSTPKLAFDGMRFLVTWVSSASSPSRIEGLRLSTAGARIDAAPFTYATTLGWNGVSSSLTYTGAHFLLAWTDSRDDTGSGTSIYAARIRTDGSLLDANGIPLGRGPGYQQLPAVAGNSTGALGVWQSDTSSFWEPTDIQGARLGVDGAVLDPTPRTLSVEPDEHSYPSLAFDGSNYLLVWMERQGGDRGVYATRVSQQGEVLDLEALRLDPSTTLTVSATNVAFNGQHYLVVWDGDHNGASGIVGARVHPDGTVLDTPPLLIATFKPGGRSVEGASVASDGQDFLVAYTGPSGTSTGGLDVFGMRILADGTRASAAELPIATQVDWQHEPAVTFDGLRYVVAWADGRAQQFGQSEIYMRRVERDGTLLPEARIASATSSSPLLASNGQGALLVWESGNNINGRTLAQDGTIGPFACIACLDGYDQRGALTFDGTHYQLVWQNGSIYSTPTNANVYLARVRTDGSVVDTTPIPVATGPAQESGPGIASNGRGGALMAFTRSGAPAVPTTSRLFLRVSTELSLGAACTRNSDCQSNFCTDGVCCDSACGGDAVDCQACSVARGALEDGRCAPLPAGTVCRAARSSTCDVAEQCDGVVTACPADVMADAGTPCSDGNACSQGEACDLGYCWGGRWVVCNTPDVCQSSAGHCEPSTGACSYEPLPDGTYCTGGWCSAGACMPLEPPDGGSSSDGGADGGADAGDGGADAGDGGAHTPDAGGVDGGGTDAGVRTDGGSPPGHEPSSPEESGCGCTEASGASLWALLLMGMWLARRAR